MRKIDNILNNLTFKTYMQDIERAEKTRKFCLHGLSHCLDVARIGYIINLEEKLGYEKETIYAAALLHDIGRRSEYQNGTPHHEAGALIALDILREIGYDREEAEIIADAISHHKTVCVEKKDLRYVLYKADKLSRNCFNCPVSDECYWKKELKNKTIVS